MADATLLPCPFCGGVAQVKPRVGKFAAEVFCGADFCGVNPVSSSLDLAYAKARWNTRQPQLPSDDGLIKALERAEEFLRRLADGDCMVMAETVEEEADAVREALSRHKAPLSEIQSNKVSKP